MEFAFALKKLLSFFLTPFALCLGLVVSGWFLLLFGNARIRIDPGRERPQRGRRLRLAGLSCVAMGLILLHAASISPVARRLAAGLERQHPPLALPDESADGRVPLPQAPPPEFIVVLAGGQLWGEGKPTLSRLSHSSLARTLGAVELAGYFPGITFVVTGTPLETEAMRDVAIRLGIPRRSIVRERQSRDTADHPRFVGEIVGESPFLLVTSATHQARAMALFRGAGLDPVAAPVDFRAWDPGTGSIAGQSPSLLQWLTPNPRHLDLTHITCHERLGLAWARFSGQTAQTP